MLKEGLRTAQLIKGLYQLNQSTDQQQKAVAAAYLKDIMDNEKGLFLKLG